jgi:iron transport multicopper oxidase
MIKLVLSVLALGLSQTVLADQTFTWATTWVSAAPDGFTRPVIGINGAWPCPTITGKVGEIITIHLANKLGNESTSLHFHGLKQLNTPFMDGPAGVTQCPIAPGKVLAYHITLQDLHVNTGSSLTYSFVLDSPGTYWYHSHNKGQYPDGLRAPIIVEYPALPWKFTAEYVLTVSDWYHTQTPAIINAFQSPSQSPPATPSPDSIIMNDGVFSNYRLIPGNTYLFHIINIGAFPSFFLNFANVGFSVIGLDGTTTRNTSTPAGTLYVGAAQRYRVLVVAPQNPTTQGAFTAVVDTSMFEAAYSGPPAIFGTLDYGLTTSSTVYTTALAAGTFPNTIMPPADDLIFKPLTTVPLYGPVTKQFVLNFTIGLVDGIAQ